MQAVKEKRKVILTHFSGEYNLNLTKLCVPLKYTPFSECGDSDCYYVCDSDADIGTRVLVLPPSQIMYMDLGDNTFDPNDYIIPETD